MSVPGQCDEHAEHIDQELSIVSCDRRDGHDGDHYDENYRVAWRYATEPPDDLV